jgi:ATP-dependent exoDNAse (exonuclease V) beta subunit
MTTLRDHVERERFATELDRNFSVLASAGSGKTYAITERVLALAKSARALEWLPQLVVVTFTNRAADEMQQRSRQRLLESDVNFDVIAAFDRAFFGTIHSFCVKLLRAHGHTLGLPAKFEVITDDGPLWRAFLQQYNRVGTSLSEGARKRLFRHVRVSDVLKLGHRCAHDLRVETPDDTCEEIDYGQLLSFMPSRKAAIANIQRSQKAVQEWLNVTKYTEDFAPLPELFGQSKPFLAEWNETFAPLCEWLQRAALCVACETAQRFREFRLKRGALTYDDQIALARELLRHPEVAQRIREKKYRVILDEAQDTDPSNSPCSRKSLARPKRATNGPTAVAPPALVISVWSAIFSSRSTAAVRTWTAIAGFTMRWLVMVVKR